MIKVTVELMSARGSQYNKLLGVAEIWNDATGTREIGNYKIRLSKINNPKETWKKGEIKGFKRASRFGAWDLLALALIAVLGDRLVKAIEKNAKI